MRNNDCVESLVDLGLSQLEAQVYLCLLQEAPATGYKIAKVLGRPVSNIYSVIKAMEDKGLILVDDGEKQVCRAVPPGELLHLLEQQFLTRKQRAESFVKDLPVAEVDNRVYKLPSAEQVFEKASRMLQTCHGIALVDAFPLLLERLRASISRAVSRQVRVAVLAYEPTSIEGASVVIHRHADAVIKRWPGQWLTMAIDAEQMLLAYLDQRGREVHHAVWSSSPTVSWAYHSCAYSDLVLSAILPVTRSKTSSGQAYSTYEQMIEKVPYPDVPRAIGIAPVEGQPKPNGYLKGAT
jgi:sugar-specific transcriptional regulator TrmB